MVLFKCYSSSTLWEATTAQTRLETHRLSTCMASLSGLGGAIMYAIIEAGGKQLKVEEGQEIIVEKLQADKNETVAFDKVLMVGGETVKVGAPYVEGASVTAKVKEHGRHKKVTIYKFKPKKNYSRKQGHRQPYTKVVIEKINA